MRWSCRRKGRPEVWTAVMWTRRGPETTTASPGVVTVTLVVRREGVSHDELATVRPNYRLCQCGGGHRGVHPTAQAGGARWLRGLLASSHALARPDLRVVGYEPGVSKLRAPA